MISRTGSLDDGIDPIRLVEPGISDGVRFRRRLRGLFAMGILSDFFLADPSPVPNYDAGRGVDETDKLQSTGITPLQAAQVLATLRGVPYDVAMIREFPFLTPEDADEWTMAVPAEMVERLAAFDDSRLPDLADDIAVATSEEWNSTAEDCLPIARGLVELARRADANGKTMYLWNSL